MSNTQKAIILVMGATGTGKSTFINQFLPPNGKLPTGDRLESITDKPVKVEGKINNKPVDFIDTPGTDDSKIAEVMVMKNIAEFLMTNYQNGLKVNGIIYMRDIRKVRTTQTDKANMNVFRKFIGEESFKNVVLMTSFWPALGDTAMVECRNREKELENTFWKDMLDKGAKIRRFNLNA